MHIIGGSSGREGVFDERTCFLLLKLVIVLALSEGGGGGFISPLSVSVGFAETAGLSLGRCLILDEASEACVQVGAEAGWPSYDW